MQISTGTVLFCCIPTWIWGSILVPVICALCVFQFQNLCSHPKLLQRVKHCIHKRAACALRSSHTACKRRTVNKFSTNLRRTKDARCMERTPGAWKRHPAHPVLFVFVRKLTNFGSWRTVYESFADGTPQVRSPVHTYAHLVCKPYASGSRTIRRARVYEA